ncbi:MAG TPA: hypothetical protein VFV09_05955 [Actinomycetota bacterium]|jgi:hypothetical protein|nr:hypothetical protein [Actinomycetota bacterium]
MIQTKIAGAWFLIIALLFTGDRLGYLSLSATAFASVVLISIGTTMMFRTEPGDTHAR